MDYQLSRLPENSVLVFGKNWSHIQDVSGLGPLSQALKTISANTCLFHKLELRSANSKSLFKRLKAKTSKLVERNPKKHLVPWGDKPFYGVTDHNPDIGRIIYSLSATRPDIRYLLLAGEDQLDEILVNSELEIKSKIAIMFHQPASWFKLNLVNPAFLDGFSLIVTVSSSQASYFNQINNSNVISIMHGVDSCFFVPRADRAQHLTRLPHRLLFVGQWLRDFKTLFETYSLINMIDSTIQLDCVIPPHTRTSESLHRLAAYKNVRFHANISSSELLRLYQDSHLLLLPLKDATANNAICEAMATGLPVVTSNVGSVSEYVPAQVGELCVSGDAKDHANAVMDWLSNPQRILDASVACRNFATSQLNWRTGAQAILNAMPAVI